MGEIFDRKLERREFLQLGAFAAVAATLAACSPAALASPTSASAAPASSGSAAPASGGLPSSSVPAPSVVSRAPIHLKLGHGFTVDSLNHKTWLEMAQAVNVRTNGEVTIDLYPNSTLGTDVELRDQLSLGAPIINGFAYGSGAAQVPELALFEAPFNFANHAEAVKVANSDLMDELIQKLYAKAGWQIFVRNYDNGPRHIINKLRDVKVPADLKGMKFRVPQAPIYVDTFTALGATPVPLALPDIYPGLQQGLIDGAEGFVSSINDLHFPEVAKHLTLSGHIWQNAGMIGGKFFNALPEDIRKIVQEEATNSGDVYSTRNAEGVAKGLTTMKAAGVTVTEVDVAVWRTAAEPVYEKLRPTLTPGVIERFRKLRDS
jgi:tripartite ATP-independent transporter DctP family solute receptor